MCGRYTLLAEEVQILNEYQLEQDRIESYQSSYNIAPGQKVLAIIHDGRRKRAGYLRWGLIPSWAEDEKIGYKMINARSETAHQKPSFKRLMSRKRCLIIADSFYEWKKANGEKQPKRIRTSNRQLFSFAGLWDKWESQDKEVYTCTILTKDADNFMRDIHDRMPIILPKDKEDLWIKPEKQSPTEAHQFLASLSTEKLTAYDVGTHVNSAKNNDAVCIEPLL